MIYKLKNKPVWYKIWAVSIALAAVYLLIRIAFAWFYVGDFAKGLLPYDYLIAALINISILLDMFLFPTPKEKDK